MFAAQEEIHLRPNSEESTVMEKPGIKVPVSDENWEWLCSVCGTTDQDAIDNLANQIITEAREREESTGVVELQSTCEERGCKKE
jgi:hypothetical protein